MDDCDITTQHITVKHVPFIVVAIAVCFGLEGVMLKWTISLKELHLPTPSDRGCRDYDFLLAYIQFNIV